MSGRALAPQHEEEELLDFLRAMDTFKRKKQKSYPTLDETFGVLAELGWGKAGLNGEEARRAFSNAIAALKTRTREPFPTWSEILGEIRRCGWKKKVSLARK